MNGDEKIIEFGNVAEKEGTGSEKVVDLPD
jgi:hypothetical protein